VPHSLPLYRRTRLTGAVLAAEPISQAEWPVLLEKLCIEVLISEPKYRLTEKLRLARVPQTLAPSLLLAQYDHPTAVV